MSPATASPRTAPEVPPPVAGRGRRWLFALTAVVLLAQMAIAMVTTAVEQTPTVDEPVYVGAAAVYPGEHDLRYNREHPPLGKLVVAAGLAFADVRFAEDFTGDQTAFGRHVLYESGNDPGKLLLLARLPVIVLTLVFGLVVLLFARDLTGTAGGLVALALYAFSPDLIAHGSLATLDVPAAGFALTSAWLVRRARGNPRYLPLAGLALGAALATKVNTLAVVPVVVFLAWHAGRRGRPVVLMALTAVAVVWASYAAVHPSLPFAELYLEGVRLQLGLEDRVWGGYLFGTHYEGSRWYYLPAALLVKTPLGALVLWAAGVAVMLSRLRQEALYVLLPAAVLLAVAMTGNRDLGVRYAIFVPMFLAVAAASVVLVRRRWAFVAVALVAVSSLRTFPYYLPYSNEAFGGTAKTHLHLHDSNVDWGQDLGRLAQRLERHRGERIWFVHKGAGVPEHYGIHAEDPREVPPERVRGVLVVSDTAIAKADDRLKALLAGSTPVDRVGHSITIFRRP
ncbi:glycosyltransferase family 39 protein [Lentzea xinjiangensis]|uniref:glycosyltransferase family 39 protein n=1 Tax=Lentzea xinjiangensis TaxID=402600 RepID=UPI001FE73C4C|nr:glycosyltransferase family 39 protein [Lentzea xinjiangensis]